ncbi:hypothetical protein ACIF9R_37730 [Streptomyces sp. NPDC086080]|uniref:hypothetical protein n=1 Tax=Streptomyces sp. NPDC086080 TaxID=3365748 RepID=UPI0037CED34E
MASGLRSRCGPSWSSTSYLDYEAEEYTGKDNIDNKGEDDVDKDDVFLKMDKLDVVRNSGESGRFTSIWQMEVPEMYASTNRPGPMQVQRLVRGGRDACRRNVRRARVLLADAFDDQVALVVEVGRELVRRVVVAGPRCSWAWCPWLAS